MHFNLRSGLQGIGILAAAVASVATSSPAEVLASKTKSDDSRSVVLSAAAPVRTFKVRVHAERKQAAGTFNLSLHVGTRGVVIRGDARLANAVCARYSNPASAPTQSPSYACIERGQEHPNVVISLRRVTTVAFGQINGVEFGADATSSGLYPSYFPGVCYTYGANGQLQSGSCEETYRPEPGSCRDERSCDLDIVVKLALIDPTLGTDTIPLTLASVVEAEGAADDLQEIVISELP